MRLYHNTTKAFSIISIVGLLSIASTFSACYKPAIPTQDPNALGVKIYRGKSSLKDCTYLRESSGIVNTKGYGIKLLAAIAGAENDLRNKAARFGGNAVLVLHTESRYLGGDYQFRMGLANDAISNKIDEYIIYGEVYHCKF
ncbi:DUF4156 domain-containing protein [Helicobacter sp.]|uniref:DUF4156 domain-containing protein n=1 Tax=Helicobacter sp. TaxID=218 RepID=UPI0025BF811E|nr:DUF4156 domain-containing protein [Helicobacter sp.]MBR2494344.1 DUF4156 domain-containing protein [Helicobacter sp.]